MFRPPNPGLPNPFCKPFPLLLAWRPDSKSKQSTQSSSSFAALGVDVAVFKKICESLSPNNDKTKTTGTSLSLLFGYHGCLRLQNGWLYQLKPTINSGISSLKHRPRRKSRSGAWKHHFHLKWTKSAETIFEQVLFAKIRTKFSHHMFFQNWRASTLVTVTKSRRINSWRDGSSNGDIQQGKQKFTLPRDPYPAFGVGFACGVGVPGFMWMFYRKIWDLVNISAPTNRLSCWLAGWPLTSARSLDLKSSCGSGLGGPNWNVSKQIVIREVVWFRIPELWCRGVSRKSGHCSSVHQKIFGLENLIHLQMSNDFNATKLHRMVVLPLPFSTMKWPYIHVLLRRHCWSLGNIRDQQKAWGANCSGKYPKPITKRRWRIHSSVRPKSSWGKCDVFFGKFKDETKHRDDKDM